MVDGDSANTQRTRLIHVGLGGWGGDWERNAIPPVPEVERVAVVDAHEPTLRRAQEALDLPDAACFTSLRAAVDAVRADGVLVTAPVQFHVPVALEALDAGLHVLVEKPFAPSVAEARTAVARAEERGLVLQVSQNYRAYPAPRAVRELVAGGAIGDLSVVHVDFRRWANDAPVETNRHYAFPHPLLHDMAIHHFDLLRMVTGREAVRVYAKVTDPPWSRFEQEASAVLTIEMAGGLVASYRGSWVSRGPQTAWDGEWALEGERGRITFTGRGGEGPGDDAVTLSRGGGEPEEVELPALELWGRSAGLRQFHRAVQGGPAPEVTGRSNLGSLAIAEAAARSVESGRVEDVEQVGEL
ncbi:Gfo/Idh/MocA family oxidoreductase [Paenibacillus sp. TRM 82003]|uniref:Gfo/Idh/MocA family protein n=1 Tax=Kineococcus sp. TRM81007 TaxID=2925831 RepID=UPI001F55B1EB|nr:Gfo/Idh/MocA family oxidoreductase [Kineococcus sp. TRM81007]MCI2236905.1 Gfo/Idh/MocA family oxidoreductase [Kineococcus sp. TRM81007]MCI3921897.1 Gfo/Idh/MocA family oxidoreductase [Paenibacillus sp. TRM 82003]